MDKKVIILIIVVVAIVIMAVIAYFIYAKSKPSTKDAPLETVTTSQTVTHGGAGSALIAGLKLI